MTTRFEPVHEAGTQMEQLTLQLAAIGIHPTAKNLALLQAIVIVQAQENGLSRDDVVAWVGRMFDSIAEDRKAAQR